MDKKFKQPTVYFALDIETVALPEKEELFKEWYPKTKPDKMALNPNFAQIVCICCCGGTAQSQYQKVVGKDTIASETDLLRDFWMWVSQFGYPHIITFNGKSFDIPFLLRRSFFNKIKPSHFFDTQRWKNINHTDLFLTLNHGSIEKGGLDFYAKEVLGIDLTEGNMVAQWWAGGKRDEILGHCWTQTQATWELYRTMQGYYEGV